MSTDKLPLAGLRVVEAAQNLAGPWCGQILSDMGAAVIKVERPEGDASRAWGPPFIGDAGTIFSSTNRGKRSIALDVHTEHGARTLRALIEQADILIESFRPGDFARLGFDFDSVHAWNPSLIYCSVLAYGESGPLSNLPGYDPLMQAHAGLMSVTGGHEGEPARVGTSVVDIGTGMWLAIGVLAALRERDASGTGRRISVALYDTALAWNAYHLIGYHVAGNVPAPMGSEMPMIVPYGAFPTRDSQIMIGAANDGLFTRLCTALGLGPLYHDRRFATNPERVSRRGELNAIVARATFTFSSTELLKMLRDAGVPCAPIQDIAEVAVDPQTAASEMIVAGNGDAAVALPIRWDGARFNVGNAAPSIGEHTDEITAEL